MNMRDGDWKELQLTGPSKEHWLSLAMTCAGDKYCCVRDGEPIAIGGLQPHHNQVVSWMWGTDRIPEVGLELTRYCKRMTDEALIETNRLVAASASFRDDTHEWLKSIGFRRCVDLGNNLILFDKVKKHVWTS